MKNIACRIRVLVLLVMVSTLSASRTVEAASSAALVDRLVDGLVQQLSTSTPEEQKLSVAVGAITDLDDCSNAFGRLVGDQVATKLVMSGRFDVVERQHLEAVLAELHLQG